MPSTPKFILLISLSGLSGASSFVATPPSHLHVTFHHLHHLARPASTTNLRAKVSGKKKKKKKGGGGASAIGGFGKKYAAPTARSLDDEDVFAAFPALEASVKQTLVPFDAASNAEEVEGSDLNSEMYDRLAQIYGFERFNLQDWDEPEPGEKEAKEEEEESAAPSMSFDELLSSSDGGGTITSSPSSDFSDLLGGSKSSSSSDFSDLIASASGGVAPSKQGAVPSPIPSAAASVDIDLSNLPPFSKFRVLHVDPMVLAIDDFFTREECDAYVDLALKPDEMAKKDALPTVELRSRTVGKDSRARAQRTSTTWFNHYKAVPGLMAKASRLLGLRGIERWEEPQIVRYRKSEKFTWHLDALAPSDDLASGGGQRIATLLVYLTDLKDWEGGATMFRDLGGEDGPLKVRPKKGSACLFFPAAGGIPNVPFDIRTLHCGEAVSEAASNDKWISQLWLREGAYAPTAPPGNAHAAAAEAINEYCNNYGVEQRGR